jgi:hypothetical protein
MTRREYWCNETPGIGLLKAFHISEKAPSMQSSVLDHIKSPRVRLPTGLAFEEYKQMRKEVQEKVVSHEGVTAARAQEISLKLGGIVLEGVVPYAVPQLLGMGEQRNMHMIFQTGLNFGGTEKGGIPLTSPDQVTDEQINTYYAAAASATVQSAIKNGSRCLVYNTDMGGGCFAGEKGDVLKQATIEGLIAALKNKGDLELYVPNVGHSEKEMQQLKAADIQVVSADKDALAALLAQEYEDGKVSLHIAGDPMSMLGIHGLGFGFAIDESGSDENRAAFLTPCYLLGYIPL